MPTVNTHLPNAIDRSATLAELVKCALAECFPSDNHDSANRLIRAEASAGMIQTYCYVAYPGSYGLINSIPLTDRIRDYAESVQASWDGERFDYDAYVVTIIGWLNATTNGRIS